LDHTHLTLPSPPSRAERDFSEGSAFLALRQLSSAIATRATLIDPGASDEPQRNGVV